MTARAVFAWPLLLGALSLVGLVAGLLGGGWFDVACWAGLAAPILAAGVAWRRRAARQPAHAARRPVDRRQP